MSRIKPAVSLYSLQDEYLNHRMDLADIMRYVKEQGAEGVEILPDQMLKGAPHISDETLNQWNSPLAETGLAPVIADVFLNTNLYKNRTLTRKECIELLAEEIRQAARLGIHLIRLVSMVPYWVIEPLLPYCEAYDVAIALEIHAGMAFDIPETKAFIEEMKRVNSRYVGLVIDTGIFCRRFPRVVRAYETQNGTSQEVFDYIDTLFEKGSDLHRDEYMPYIKHFHFKLFEMTPEGPEYSMDYKGLLQYLHRKGYDGYVATEYEGNRFTLPGEKMKEKEQVAAQLSYIRKCLNEMEGQEGR